NILTVNILTQRISTHTVRDDAILQEEHATCGYLDVPSCLRGVVIRDGREPECRLSWSIDASAFVPSLVIGDCAVVERDFCVHIAHDSTTVAFRSVVRDCTAVGDDYEVAPNSGASASIHGKILGDGSIDEDQVSLVLYAATKRGLIVLEDDAD